MSDAIRWLDWDASAFAQAARLNTPILLSLVTAWSDECRVMDETTFADAAVAAVLSSQFVTIRVDGERRPDVNERYNLGAWPTTVFLTPEADILSGATYLPPDRMIALARQVVEAWREREGDLRARTLERRRALTPRTGGPDQPPDVDAVDHLRSLLVDEFDSRHGGFGEAPKVPHTAALLLLLSLLSSGDRDDHDHLAAIVDTTLDSMWALWDAERGGFFRFAEEADWSRPGREKTLEDQAANLHVYVEAALRRPSGNTNDRIARIANWVTSELADPLAGGFYNAQSPTQTDRSMYTDGTADMAAACLRAADVLGDAPLRNFALKSLEGVILSGYVPGGGVAHTRDGVRGLLNDQVSVASAAMWSYVVAEQLPYCMLASELMQFAIRTMWEEAAGLFRDRVAVEDPVYPFQSNCDAARVLDRLAIITGEESFRERAMTVLGSLAAEYPRQGIYGASYALAVREVVDRRPPAGLHLVRVEW